MDKSKHSPWPSVPETSGPPLSEAPCCLELVSRELPRFFRSLGEAARLAIVARLAQCGRGCTVGEIARCMKLDMSVVSRHLAQLRDAGILHSERRSKYVYYSVEYGEFVRLLRRMADEIEACCPGKSDCASAGCCAPEPAASAQSEHVPNCSPNPKGQLQ